MMNSNPATFSLMFFLNLASLNVLQPTVPPIEVTEAFPTLTMLLAVAVVVPTRSPAAVAVTTSSFCAGLAVPMPTLPLLVAKFAPRVELAVVNDPAAGVVAPTVPLMLMLAVPVKFVTVPEDGVPSAPLNVTNAPALPTAMPRAVSTFAPVVTVAGAAPAPPPAPPCSPPGVDPLSPPENPCPGVPDPPADTEPPRPPEPPPEPPAAPTNTNFPTIYPGITVTKSASSALSGNVINTGNITLTAAGATTMTVTSTGANITGYMNSTGNIIAGNVMGGANVNATLHSGTTVSVTGVITGASVVGGVITGTSASVTGIVTGASVVGGVITGSSASVTGIVTGASVVGGVMTGSSISVSGAVTGASLTVGTGTITGGNIVNGNGNGIGNIGSSTVYFNTVFAKATSAQYADLAELYTADAEYEPGTVVEFGGAAEVTLSTKVGSTRVAGVVSTNPSYIMNASLQAEHVATVALQGRVPCKVIGPVSKGDMMVAAGNGYAKVDNNARAGTIIGKALDTLHDPYGVIEVVVGRN